MKAISIKQPWANFIEQGTKTIEIRSWQTKHRGPLLIVASLQPSPILKKFSEVDKQGRHKVQDREYFDFDYLHFGRAICVVELYNITEFRPNHEDAAMCEHMPGLFAWHLRNIKQVQPVAFKGKLSIYEVEQNKIIEL